MNTFVSWLVPVAVGIVAGRPAPRLVNMMRGGSPNTSQRLMRARVVLQLVAIVVIMGVVWWRGT
jgi:hypothetical protein